MKELCAVQIISVHKYWMYENKFVSLSQNNKNNKIMKKTLFVLMCFLLTIISAGCSNDEDSNTPNNESDSCISGTIIYNEEIDNIVLIKELNIPEGNYKYKNLGAIIIPKDEFPFQQYHTGDIISFKIVEVRYTFPFNHEEFDKPIYYICSIKLCK